MSATDDMIRNAASYAADFDHTGLTTAPARGVAIVACMDSRLNPQGLFRLREGDAHVIRNAGESSPMTPSVRWPFRSGSSAPPRSCSCTTRVAGC